MIPQLLTQYLNKWLRFIIFSFLIQSSIVKIFILLNNLTLSLYGILHSCTTLIGIIDSLPIPLCQPIRNHRAKGASEIVNIGFNATKQIWFYGLKFHAILHRSGLILNFILSSAWFPDSKVCEDCLVDFHIPISNRRYRLYRQGLSPTLRWASNTAHCHTSMSKNGMYYRPIKAIKKTEETVFSGFQGFGIERLTLHQLPSIMTRIQLIVILYNLLEVESHQVEPMTLKFSTGINTWINQLAL